MRYFVYCKEQILICGRADHVCGEEEGPGERCCVAQEMCAEDLKQHDGENEILCQWLGAAELENLIQ
jgi:hypothetical protein